MRQYQHLLLAVELNPEVDNLLVQKVREITIDSSAKITCLHTIEHFSSFGAAYTVSAGINVEEELVEGAKKSMQKLAQALSIPEEQQLIQIGMAKQIILEKAKKLGVDLIVIGSHGRHGVRLLLGSTASAVLHGAKCDVLAVRVV